MSGALDTKGSRTMIRNLNISKYVCGDLLNSFCADIIIFFEGFALVSSVSCVVLSVKGITGVFWFGFVIVCSSTK